MLVPRLVVSVTVLRDGRILVAGGVHHDRLVATADIYDPRSNRWVRAGRLRQPRNLPGGVRLADGRVLVAGGAAEAGVGRRLATAEIYDPRRGR